MSQWSSIFGKIIPNKHEMIVMQLRAEICDT